MTFQTRHSEITIVDGLLHRNGVQIATSDPKEADIIAADLTEALGDDKVVPVRLRRNEWEPPKIRFRLAVPPLEGS